ncbi:FAD-dependent oxidoreductase [Hyphococcus flavus]|uniref:FAD-dependent oxidoreductase n=1 Tax=Hyphococcus flavus TaxID=1866326 RepID=A0AAE9ZA15_9PROT|nr:FAD-dependent oxidoreductase [Hyphococcus flavus]WDI30279.1 FAD-dependent oxidoreductase [Hyphococcus flavus]
MPQTLKADLCVIGAGSGGLSIAAGAAQLGRKVILIEKGEMGGDCLNTGCVPSKALIAAAARAHAMRNAGKYGLTAIDPDIDFAAVMDHVHAAIAAIEPNDSQERFEKLGVKVLREKATFTGPRELEAGEYNVKAKHFVIATGSRPFIPPIEGFKETPFFTNETIFQNKARPVHLIIIGGGPIGVEMAQAHRRLGSETTLIEGGTILNREDSDLTSVVREQLLSDGVQLLEHTKAARAEKTESGIRITTDKGTVDGTHLLIAVGRKPVVEELNLGPAGVDYDERGVKTDARLRTSNKRIYAVGDVTGGRQFTHVAGYHASVVVRNILFKMPSKNRENFSPRVTYCDPELAQVGLTENEAREKHKDIRIATWPFTDNDRAITEKDTRGHVKIITNKKGLILGAGIVGKEAGDLLAPWIMAVTEGLKIRAFTDMIAPYPTRSEAGKRAAGAWYTPTLFSNKTRSLVRLLSTFD